MSVSYCKNLKQIVWSVREEALWGFWKLFFKARAGLWLLGSSRVSSCNKLSASVRPPACLRDPAYGRGITVNCRHWHADSVICATKWWSRYSGELNVTTQISTQLLNLKRRRWSCRYFFPRLNYLVFSLFPGRLGDILVPVATKLNLNYNRRHF